MVGIRKIFKKYFRWEELKTAFFHLNFINIYIILKFYALQFLVTLCNALGLSRCTFGWPVMYSVGSKYCHFLLFTILRESENFTLVNLRPFHFFFFLLLFSFLNSALSIVVISIIGRVCVRPTQCLFRNISDVSVFIIRKGMDFSSKCIDIDGLF